MIITEHLLQIHLQKAKSQWAADFSVLLYFLFLPLCLLCSFTFSDIFAFLPASYFFAKFNVIWHSVISSLSQKYLLCFQYHIRHHWLLLRLALLHESFKAPVVLIEIQKEHMFHFSKEQGDGVALCHQDSHIH